MGGGFSDGYPTVRLRDGALTKQRVAEAIPDARTVVPNPSPLHTGDQGEEDSEDRQQQVTDADVDEEEVGGTPQPLEFAVKHQHEEVIAEAHSTHRAHDDRQHLVSASAEERFGRDLSAVRCIHRCGLLDSDILCGRPPEPRCRK